MVTLQCSLTCGNGTQERRARCVDMEGRELDDSDCHQGDRIVTTACNTQPCPRWETGDWIAVSLAERCLIDNTMKFRAAKLLTILGRIAHLV
jgi:hypothetical protein